MLGRSHKLLTGRYGAQIAGVFGFACMFSFPALPIPIGNAATLDPSQLMTVAMLLLQPSIFFGPSFPIILLIMAPMVQSALAWFASGGAFAPGLMLKNIIVYFRDVLPLVAAFEVLRAGRFRQLLIGVCVALVVHSFLGMYQMYAFTQGFVPFLDIMSTNPGLAIPPEISADYAQYVARPFGLFAEPSAMAGCIGPWLVLIAGLATNTTRLRVHRGILALALLSGCFLLAVSESGQSPVILAGLVVGVGGTLIRRDAASATRGRTWAAAVLMLGVVVATGLKYASLFGQREGGLEGRQDSSWDRRLNSFQFVFDALSHDVQTFLFGVGPGQTYSMIASGMRFTGGLGPEVTSVWSVTGGYVVETGVFGLACLAVIAGAAAVSIWTSTERTLGISCALVWFLGILFATNYSAQPAIWFFLAVLLNWNKQFGLRQVEAFPGKSARVLATP